MCLDKTSGFYRVWPGKIKAVLPQNRNGRYIKLLIKNNDKLPDWHDSKGNPAWIFLDELMVE